MRVLIATIGSEGDVQPFLALAKRLIDAGHDVTFATSDKYEARATSLGIRHVAIGPPWVDAEIEGRFVRVLAQKNPLKQLSIVIEELADEERLSVPKLMDLARGADVVVYPPLLVAAVVAARAVGTPHVSVHLAPLHRTRNHGPTGANAGPWLNAFGWWLAGALLRRATDARLNAIVTAGGLAPWHDVLLEASHSRLLDLVAVSPHVIPHDPLFPRVTHVTGYWFLDERGFTPPPALASFVGDRKPLVVGFGSMIGLDTKQTTATILEAVSTLDCPVVLQAGWAKLGKAMLPKNVHVAGFVPHGWLFPRARAVVHHGGAGTTAAAFRAGIPQAIVWHLGDQPAWGKSVEKLGVGPAMRSHHELDARWLRAAIDRLLTDKEMATAATSLGTAIRAEDGTAEAVRAIEAAVAEATTAAVASTHSPLVA